MYTSFGIGSDFRNGIVEYALESVFVQGLNIRQININELLEAILKRLKPIADKKKIEVVLESFRPVSAEIDEMKLTLAISNLVENAIKYNRDEGWVRVSLKDLDPTMA